MPTATQMDEFQYLMQPEIAGLLCNEYSFSGWHGYKCIGAAGIVSQGGGRGEAWLLLGDEAKPHMLEITKQALGVLGNNHFRRVEMTVKEDNKVGHRIAKMLKFKAEATLEAWHPDGSNVVLYKRIKR